MGSTRHPQRILPHGSAHPRAVERARTGERRHPARPLRGFRRSRRRGPRLQPTVASDRALSPRRPRLGPGPPSRVPRPQNPPSPPHRRRTRRLAPRRSPASDRTVSREAALRPCQRRRRRTPRDRRFPTTMTTSTCCATPPPARPAAARIAHGPHAYLRGCPQTTSRLTSRGTSPLRTLPRRPPLPQFYHPRPGPRRPATTHGHSSPIGYLPLRPTPEPGGTSKRNLREFVHLLVLISPAKAIYSPHMSRLTLLRVRSDSLVAPRSRRSRSARHKVGLPPAARHYGTMLNVTAQ